MEDELIESEIEELRRLEEALWKPETRYDRAFMARVLAEDFWEIGRSGRVYTREATLAAPPRPFETVLPLPGFTARALGPGAVQVSYTSILTAGGVMERGLRSSLWTRAGEGWVLRFHQGTPAPAAEETNKK